MLSYCLTFSSVATDCNIYNKLLFFRFVQDLRQRATKEYNANPLLRRLKRQIRNEDNHDEVRPRRSLDTPKWRINVVEGVKRKYSCDHIVCDKNGVKASERTTFVRTKSGHRSNQQQMLKMGQLSRHGLCYQQSGRDKICVYL